MAGVNNETNKKPQGNDYTGANAPVARNNGNATPGAMPRSSGASVPQNTGTSDASQGATVSQPQDGYTSLNTQVWGEGGSGYAGQMEQAEIESDKRHENPNYGNMSYTDLVNFGVENGIDPSRFYVNPSRGAYAQDPNYVYSDRTTENGASGADEFWMNDGLLDLIRMAQENFMNAKDPSEQAYWRNIAESCRNVMDYSGGADGSMYITRGEMDYAGRRGQYGPGGDFYGPNGGTGRPGSNAGMIGSGGNGMQGYLDAWQQAAINQANGQIDYGVQRAVTDLQRALADAQAQFKEQAEGVDRNALQAMDNAALYAELRGDKGGIGGEQYNSIQNTRAQNHLAVQQAQTKLATDTQRQIADLRAQGEFEKADAALEITQQYLQQLISLEQWAAEYNLSVEQFNASLQQWQAEYDMAMMQIQIGQDQWQQQFDYQKQSDLANVGWALLEAGVPLSQEQMDAMGIDASQASQVLWQAQLAATGNGSEGKPSNVYQWLAENGAVDQASAYNLLVSGGYSSTEANNFAKYFMEWDGYEAATVGLSPSFDYILAQAQTMTREEAIPYLKGMATKGRKNGGITAPEMEWILGNARFADKDTNSPYTPYEPVSVS